MAIDPAISITAPITGMMNSGASGASVASKEVQDPPLPNEYYTDINGNEVTTYEVSPDGNVSSHVGSSGNSSQSDGMIGSIGHFLDSNAVAKKVKQFLVPENMPGSVSKDYTATRAWSFLQGIGWNAANYASGAALAMAMGVNPLWGGAAMATFNLIRDKLGLFTGFAATGIVPAIDRNPRPWMIAGEAIDHAGIIVESAASLTAAVPGALLPIGLAGCLLRTISGSIKGPAMANIDPRQAMAGNLGEVQKKNSNQNVIANLIGSAAGVYAIHFLSTLGLGALGPAIVAAAGAAMSVASVTGMVKSLDFHPINEKAIRRVIDRLEQDKKVVGPDTSLWSTVKSIGEKDTIVLGNEKLKPGPDSIAHIRDLKKIYGGRNYMLDVKDGKPKIYLKKDCTPEDRFTATMQGIYVERLRGSEEYSKKLASGGAAEADRWLIDASLKKTPADPKPLLKAMQKAGWSTDLLRSRDEGMRATWEGTPDEDELQYELALPEPPPKPGSQQQSKAAE
jgi:hypothetical protein